MINNFLSYVIGVAPNKYYYSIKILDITSLLLLITNNFTSLFEKAYRNLRLTRKEEVNNALIFANIMIKVRYDIKYLAINLILG